MMKFGIRMEFRHLECYGRKGMKTILKVCSNKIKTNWIRLIIGWSTDSDVRRIPMPRDTPPASSSKPNKRKPPPPPPLQTTPPQPTPQEQILEPTITKETQKETR